MRRVLAVLAALAVLFVTGAASAPSASADHYGFDPHCFQQLDVDPNSTGREYMDFEAYEGGPNFRIPEGNGHGFGLECGQTNPYQKRVYVPSGYDIRVLCDTGYYVIKKATGWHWLTTCSDGYNDYAKLKQRGDGYFG
jgi:hypothetical protein